MDHMQTLKRAWNILWSYRALWVIGIILALTSPSGFSPGSSNFSPDLNVPRRYETTPPEEIQRELEKLGELFSQGIPADTLEMLIRIGVLIVLAMLLLAILFAIGYYVSQAALIRMVDTYEQDEEKLTWKAGLRLGWSRAAWRLFLIDLVINLPIFLAFILFFGCAALPVLLKTLAGQQPTMPGIIASVGFVFLLIFVAIIINVVLSLVLEIIRRVGVLQGSDAITSIRQGLEVIRGNFKDVFIMWLILLGIKVGFFIALIPVAILLAALGLFVGGGVGFLFYTIFQATTSTLVAWIAAVLSGGILFILVLAIPMLFLEGLRETYLSSTWTLTYRELNLEMLDRSSSPEESDPSAEVAA